jgi:hypothetical protein
VDVGAHRREPEQVRGHRARGPKLGLDAILARRKAGAELGSVDARIKGLRSYDTVEAMPAAFRKQAVQCSYCTKWFETLDNLNYHRTVHPAVI